MEVSEQEEIGGMKGWSSLREIERGDAGGWNLAARGGNVVSLSHSLSAGWVRSTRWVVITAGREWSPTALLASKDGKMEGGQTKCISRVLTEENEGRGPSGW